MSKREAAVELRSVALTSEAGDSILEAIDVRIEQDSTASIIGASGSGKSSLLRLINRLDDVSSGVIMVMGRAIAEWSPRELRRLALWLPQTPRLGEGAVRDILAVPARLGLVTEERARERMPEALALAHFDESLLERESTRLSGGERQRLALARALLLEPQILLLDEPTSSLDGETAGKILSNLENWRAQVGATLIVVTHRVADVRRLGGSLLMLDRGRVIHQGIAAEVLASEAGNDIRRILAGEDAA